MTNDSLIEILRSNRYLDGGNIPLSDHQIGYNAAIYDAIVLISQHSQPKQEVGEGCSYCQDTRHIQIEDDPAEPCPKCRSSEISVAEAFERWHKPAKEKAKRDHSGRYIDDWTQALFTGFSANWLPKAEIRVSKQQDDGLLSCPFCGGCGELDMHPYSASGTIKCADCHGRALRDDWNKRYFKPVMVDLDIGTLAFDDAYKLEQDEYLPTEEIKRILQKVAKAWGLKICR